jgi:hypothetical protein
MKGVRPLVKHILLRPAGRGATKKCRGDAEKAIFSALPRSTLRKPLARLRKESGVERSQRGFFSGHEAVTRSARDWSAAPQSFNERVGEFCVQAFPIRGGHKMIFCACISL